MKKKKKTHNTLVQTRSNFTLYIHIIYLFINLFRGPINWRTEASPSLVTTYLAHIKFSHSWQHHPIHIILLIIKHWFCENSDQVFQINQNSVRMDNYWVYNQTLFIHVWWIDTEELHILFSLWKVFSCHLLKKVQGSWWG